MSYRVVITASVLLISCASTPPQESSTDFSESAARSFYDVYESALKAHRRDTLAQFYHPDGAIVVLNGSRMHATHAGIDSVYRGGWQGPRFFAFDSLRFQPLGAQHVLVTGGFRWLASQSSDTSHYIYLSILERSPNGLRIRVEHETKRPAQP
jgi:hypothetical protein